MGCASLEPQETTFRFGQVTADPQDKGLRMDKIAKPGNADAANALVEKFLHPA